MKNDGTTADDAREGLDPRDDAALWALLGRSGERPASPYFARRVLREVSLLEERRSGGRWWRPDVLWQAWRQWLPRLAYLAGTPALALVIVFFGLRMSPSPVRQTMLTPAETAPVAASPAPAGGADAPEMADLASAASATQAQGADDDLVEAARAAVAENPAPASRPAASAPAAPASAASATSDGISAQDVEVIAELDTLLKHEQNHLWTEDTARF